MPRKFLLIAGIPVAVLFILLFALLKTEDAHEHFQSTIIHENFHGIIRQKFEDRRNRGAQTVKYRASNGYDYAVLARSWIGLWENSQIGDSMYKISGDSFLHLIRPLPSIQVYQFPYNFDQGGVSIVNRFQ